MDPSSWSGTGRVSGLQVLGEDGERVFCRGESHSGGHRTAVLAVLPATEHPAPATLDRLTREHGLKDELDGAWVVRPLELAHQCARIMLCLAPTATAPPHRLLDPPTTP